MVFCLFFLLTTCIGLSQSIRCYQGFDSWGPETTRNVTLGECPSSSRCCYIISSLPGSTYGCYTDCPGAGVKQCGPGPVPNAPVDVGWCYCTREDDTLCTPYYLVNENSTTIQTTLTTTTSTMSSG
uniref:Uncharacterized protein n=1 Tax=Plectus sambesii TaxID=2011161 RepID=A0A914ULN9_9BILA